jgi:c-di-GMP-related signal transduction protein
LLDLATAIERGDWDKVSDLASKLKVKEELLSELYLSAVEWATALRSEIQQPVAH